MNTRILVFTILAILVIMLTVSSLATQEATPEPTDSRINLPPFLLGSVPSAAGTGCDIISLNTETGVIQTLATTSGAWPRDCQFVYVPGYGLFFLSTCPDQEGNEAFGVCDSNHNLITSGNTLDASGNRLVVLQSTNGQLVLVDLATNARLEIPYPWLLGSELPNSVTWSPFGDIFAVANGQNTLIVTLEWLERSGNETRPFEIRSLSFACGNGSFVSATRYDCVERGKLTTANLITGELISLYRSVFNVSWSPFLAVALLREPTRTGASLLTVNDLQQAEISVVTTTALLTIPTWSPDGNYLAYADLTDHNGEDTICFWSRLANENHCFEMSATLGWMTELQFSREDPSGNQFNQS